LSLLHFSDKLRFKIVGEQTTCTQEHECQSMFLNSFLDSSLMPHTLPKYVSSIIQEFMSIWRPIYVSSIIQEFMSIWRPIWPWTKQCCSPPLSQSYPHQSFQLDLIPNGLAQGEVTWAAKLAKATKFINY